MSTPEEIFRKRQEAGRKGGTARWANLTPEERSKLARRISTEWRTNPNYVSYKNRNPKKEHHICESDKNYTGDYWADLNADCKSPATFEVEGKWYCWNHDPTRPPRVRKKKGSP